jgi:hypothetical protein
MKTLLRSIAHPTFRGRRFHYGHLQRFARDVRGKRILEIGSGKAVDGEFIYSAQKFFDGSNTSVRSDVVDSYGHRVVDVTEMEFEEEFDVILCLNVMEHVYRFQQAFDKRVPGRNARWERDHSRRTPSDRRATSAVRAEYGGVVRRAVERRTARIAARAATPTSPPPSRSRSPAPTSGLPGCR